MKKGEGDKRRKSPSREKYEKENPTVSARLAKETRNRLRAVPAKLAMSLSAALKVLAGDLEVKVRPTDEARQAGYEEAKNRYMVTFPCDVCGKPVAITSPKAKEVVSKYMAKYGLGHAKCHE